MKIVKKISTENCHFYGHEKRCTLHGRVFVMCRCHPNYAVRHYTYNISNMLIHVHILRILIAVKLSIFS